MGEWFRENEIYKHKSHNFHRKNYTALWVIVIIILIALAFAYDVWGIKTKISKINLNLTQNSNSYSYVSIKNLAQKSSDYAGKKVIVKGYYLMSRDILFDAEGYYIYITRNCEESQRSYDYSLFGAPNTEYTTKGIFLEPEKCDLQPIGSFDRCSVSYEVKYKYRLQCTSPLE